MASKITTAQECHPDRMTVERIAARAFVILGGLFWIAASLAADMGFRGNTALVSARNALLPLLLTVVVLAVGWFFEREVAYFLGVLSAGVVVWGVVSGWEMGVWLLVATTLIAPMVISGVLFYFAGRDAEACKIEEERQSANLGAESTAH